MPDKYMFDIIPLGGTANEPFIEKDEVYYIIDGNRYLTNTNVKGSGGTPTFKDVTEPAAAQEWKIVPDANGSNCYKITSNADGRYVNEYGVFGTNQYYADWNTYLLTLMGDKWSIQWTQSAAKNGVSYIMVSGDRLEAKNVARNESYTVKIVRKGDDTSIENTVSVDFEITGDRITCDADVKSITLFTADGREVKSGKGNILAVKDVAKGVYIVVAKSDSDTRTYKVSLK
ncbi:MAG: hypothetical protein IIU97_06265 [Bacteroidaceae bacterium]|nr:hypothetical protein [Bacteroidaceae bacterium]